MSRIVLIRVIFLISIALAVIAIGYVMVGSLPGSTITISKIRKIQAASIFPEGWAFFTKDPQDEDYLIYSINKDENGKINKITSPTCSPKNAFGLNRISRLQSQELGSAIHFIKDSSWLSVKGSLESNDSIINSTTSILIPVTSKYPYFEGKYILQKITPIPWAWAKKFNLDFRKSKIVVIEFKKIVR